MVRLSFIQESGFASVVMPVRYEIVRKHHQGLLTGFDSQRATLVSFLPSLCLCHCAYAVASTSGYHSMKVDRGSVDQSINRSITQSIGQTTATRNVCSTAKRGNGGEKPDLPTAQPNLPKPHSPTLAITTFANLGDKEK